MLLSIYRLMNDTVLEVYSLNADGHTANLEGEVNKFTSLIWKECFNGYEEFELWVPITEENKSLLEQKFDYIFFTGITYDFGAKTIEISDLSDTGIATTSVDPNNSHHILEVGSKIGTFILKVTDTGVTTTYNCSVYSTVTSVALGNSLARRENITIESNAKSEEARTATYLGDTKDLLSVGIAHTSKKADSYYYSYEYDGDTYYNGVKFDIGAVDNFSSFVDKFDADYSFIDIDNSGHPLAEGSDYIMDDENDIFYFLNTNGISGHQIQVTMTPKADVENTYVNHTIPKAFKKADYSSTPLSKSYVFTLNDGVNVYDDVTLSDAMNTTASNINILNDINVNRRNSFYGNRQ